MFCSAMHCSFSGTCSTTGTCICYPKDTVTHANSYSARNAYMERATTRQARASARRIGTAIFVTNTVTRKSRGAWTLRLEFRVRVRPVLVREEVRDKNYCGAYCTKYCSTDKLAYQTCFNDGVCNNSAGRCDCAENFYRDGCTKCCDAETSCRGHGTCNIYGNWSIWTQLPDQNFRFLVGSFSCALLMSSLWPCAGKRNNNSKLLRSFIISKP